MDDAATLAQQAERLSADGKWDPAVTLAKKALDAEPAQAAALEVMGAAASAYPARWTDEVMARLEKARAKVASPAERRTLTWSALGWAAFFNRLERVRELASTPELDGGEADEAARLGALLLELGRTDEADRALAKSKSPLAAYHRARLAERKGDAAGARAGLQHLDAAGDAGVLREVGLASLALREKNAAPAKALFEKRAARTDPEETPPALKSELLLLQIRLALVENRREDAEFSGQLLVASPSTADPSALLRAVALLGPLPELTKVHE